jgi:hypothetical protein
MLPFLLIILHFSQIGFTDDLTFTALPPFCSAQADILNWLLRNFARKKTMLQKHSANSIPFNPRKIKAFLIFLK